MFTVVIYDDHSLYVWNLDDINKVHLLISHIRFERCCKTIIGGPSFLIRHYCYDCMVYSSDYQVLCAGFT